MEFDRQILKEYINLHKKKVYLIGDSLRGMILCKYNESEETCIVLEDIKSFINYLENKNIKFLETCRKNIYHIYEGKINFRSINALNIDEYLRGKHFTLESIALELNDETIKKIESKQFNFDEFLIDPVCGVKHLKNRLLSENNNYVFRDDKNSFLKAMGLIMQYGLCLSTITEYHFVTYRENLRDANKIDTSREIKRSLGLDKHGIFISLLDDYGLLSILIRDRHICKKFLPSNMMAEEN